MEDSRLFKYKNLKKINSKNFEYTQNTKDKKKDISFYESQGSILKNWINFIKRDRDNSSHGAVKSKESKNAKENFNGFIRKENKVTKIAKYFLALNIEESAKIMASLDDDSILLIAKEVARINFISSREKKSIIEEFNKIIKEEQKKIKIKEDFAYELLNKSFGKSRAKKIYKKVTGKEIFVPFDYLSKVEHQQLWSLLQNESLKTLMIVYSYLDKNQKKFIFSMMDDGLKKSFIKELVKPKKLNIDTIEFISNALREKFKFQGNLRTEKLDGSKILVDILSYMDSDYEKDLLSKIDMKTIDPVKDSEIKEKIFDLNIIFRIKDNDLHNILREFTDREIAIIIKDQKDDIRFKILSNVSKRRKVLILDDEIALEKVRTKEAKIIITSFLNYIKTLSQKGEVNIYRKNEEFL